MLVTAVGYLAIHLSPESRPQRFLVHNCPRPIEFSTFLCGAFWRRCLSVAVSILRVMDSTLLTFVGHPVVAGLGDVSAALDAAAGAEVWSLSDDDLQATIVACEAVAARQAAVGLRLVREADARDLGRRLGATSTVAWLRARLRLRPGEAKTRVELRQSPGTVET